jgi:hypothetical protein
LQRQLACWSWSIPGRLARANAPQLTDGGRGAFVYDKGDGFFTIRQDAELTGRRWLFAVYRLVAIGYFYNVTFVQLGLKDLGERALAPTVVAQQMAVLLFGAGLLSRFGRGDYEPPPLLTITEDLSTYERP